MPVKDTSLDHRLNTIRRQISDEYPDLNVIFIPYLPGNALQALEEKKYKINKHLNENDAVAYIKENISLPTHGSRFIALLSATSKPFPYIFKKEQHLALILIDYKDIEIQRQHISPDTPETSDLITGYTLAWQALNTHQKYKTGSIKAKEHKNLKITAPEITALQDTRNMMMGESFAALILEQKGKKNITWDLGKKRSEMLLKPIPMYFAERYPFPIIQDSVKLIVDDLETENLKQNNLIRRTFLMSEEIDETFDELDIKQWRIFAKNAQKMAWNKHSPKRILSSAAYSSDDAHSRMSAYMIAEKLHTSITPIKLSDAHNIFTDQDFYKEQHIKKANKRFEDILEKALIDKKPEHLLKEALKQNEALFAGDLIGWSAPALVKTAQAYSKDDVREELLREIFEGMLAKVKWEDILKLSLFIMMQKRSGKSITPKIIADKFAGDNQTLAPFKDAFLN